MNPKRLGFQAIDVHFGTFDYTVHVIFGPADNVEKYLRWKLDDPDFIWDRTSRNPRGMFFRRPGWVPVIWMPRRPRTPIDHGTFAHECVHAVRAILVDWAGIPLTQDTDEAFAHATGYLVRSVLERAK